MNRTENTIGILKSSFWIIVPKPQDYWKKYVSHYIDGTFNSAFFMDKDWVTNLLLS